MTREYAWIPMRVKTHCTGIWHYKWIWFSYYDKEIVYLTSINEIYVDRYAVTEK